MSVGAKCLLFILTKLGWYIDSSGLLFSQFMSPLYTNPVSDCLQFEVMSFFLPVKMPSSRLSLKLSNCL